MGDNPKLAEILRRTASGFEAPSSSELSAFNAVLDVDITRPAVQSAKLVLQELVERGLLEAGCSSATAIEQAMAEAERHESQLSIGVMPTARTFLENFASSRIGM